jgi:hypothetical protein
MSQFWMVLRVGLGKNGAFLALKTVLYCKMDAFVATNE